MTESSWAQIALSRPCMSAYNKNCEFLERLFFIDFDVVNFIQRIPANRSKLQVNLWSQYQVPVSFNSILDVLRWAIVRILAKHDRVWISFFSLVLVSERLVCFEIDLLCTSSTGPGKPPTTLQLKTARSDDWSNFCNSLAHICCVPKWSASVFAGSETKHLLITLEICIG